jgi:hypothetical protein
MAAKQRGPRRPTPQRPPLPLVAPRAGAAGGIRLGLLYRRLGARGYTALLAAALLLAGWPVRALFTIAGALLLLLYLGIHNAWDVVTFIVVERLAPREERGESVE